VTSETPQKPVVQEPPIIIVQTPPPHSVAPEQNNPNTIITSEPEKQTPQNVEIPQSEPNNSRPQTTNEQEIADQPPFIEILDNDSPTASYPSTPVAEQNPETHGPVYKPLNYGEFVLSYEQIQPLIEAHMKQSIDIDDSCELSTEHDKIDLSKIVIRPLKRKRHAPTIPFNHDQPFFNPASEPNLELLTIVVDISLKRLKCMKEAALVFPSDVDAEARRIEENFRESLHILTDYVKDNIKGKGMEVVRIVMTKADHSSALRLTNFNHVEECKHREDMRAAVTASVQRCIEAAKRIAEEEEAYVRIIDAELARIAAEAEIKRLADQEALKLLVDGALHIVEIETHKITENQAMGEDTIMLDQVQDGNGSDKGKAAVIDTTPPRSPVRLIQGSPSSAIPPAVQMALEDMKNDLKEELRNEMDELRADMRADINRSGEATHKKIDEMMELLLKFSSQLPKSKPFV
jgi:hypothetical protein